MSNGKKIERWLGVAISGFFILTATAEKLPPPVTGKYLAGEMMGQKIDLAGKIVKVKFNRISYAEKTKGDLYEGNLRSRPKEREDKFGIQVQFPKEGLGYFLKFFPKPGTWLRDASTLILSDEGEVYVQISTNANAGSVALGDRYEKDGDAGEYRWSVATEVPDLAGQRKVSVTDLALFPEQLDGKVVQLEFYEVGIIKQKTAEEYSTSVSCGRGHAGIPIIFPAAASEFFKEIATQQTAPKERCIYAQVTVSPKGVVFLEAKGRRAVGEGLDASYKW
jgi:hypothetical protein